METETQNQTVTTKQPLSRDFWLFWAGQTISSLGSSFTTFALPLLVFKLTGSALNLALTTAAGFLPYLFFGLIIGAWVDRTNRKQVMIWTDVARALVIAALPVLGLFGLLSVWWVYLGTFINTTLTIFFNSAEFAAIPSLVNKDDLVEANGRIQASFSAANVLGPLLAGLLVSFMAVEDVLFFDSASFLISTLLLTLIKKKLVADRTKEPTSLRKDIVEGLRYVLGHPVLRNISLMMAMVNFLASTTGAQLVFFAKERFQADDFEISLLFSVGSVGIVVLSLTAGWLRKRFSFSKVALTSLALNGLFIILISFTPWLWLALPMWGLASGLGILFNINTGSLRQTIVPNHLLGRVMSIAGVLAWSAIPVGAFLGGLAIEWTKNVALVYGIIGFWMVIIPLCFAFSPLRHAEDYLSK